MHPLRAILNAFRYGGGVPYADYGAEGNRAQFLNLLSTEWLPMLPGVHARLRADPPARVADIGYGCGWSSITLARAYPNAEVDGFDLDEPSLRIARAGAEAAGLAD